MASSFVLQRPYTAVLIVPTGVGAAIGGYAGDAFRPLQCRRFPVGEKPTFPPHGQAIQPLLVDSQVPGFGGMHVDTECTAVDLRHTNLEQCP